MIHAVFLNYGQLRGKLLVIFYWTTTGSYFKMLHVYEY